MKLNELENKIKTLEQDVNSCKGKLSLLEQQYGESLDKLENLKDLQDTNVKSVEVLNFVQKVTKGKIKDIFENVVTRALQYIHQNNNYNFELDFDRQGNLPKMRFLVKTPEMQEPHEIRYTRAGGSKDIIALALRFVLLEVSRNKGFLFLDEPFKRLDNEQTITKAVEFLKETQKKPKRQIFMITHKKEVAAMFDNPIIFTKKDYVEFKIPKFDDINDDGTLKKKTIDIVPKAEDKPKRKRGRISKHEKKM